MSTSIKLSFINDSNDQNNSDVVIFQKNAMTDFSQTAIAWRVIENLGQGDQHPFSLPLNFSVSIMDTYGNYTPQINARNGQLFHMGHDELGELLELAKEPAASPDEIDILNNQAMGSLDASIYRDGKLLARQANLAPGQRAVFEFKPTIWIGVVPKIKEGQVMAAAAIANVNTEISLLGIASADIVMTGGGRGPRATAFKFVLENIINA